MSDITLKEKEEEEVKMEKPKLQLITGGKEQPPGTGNWLRDLDVGTVFFVQDKKDFSNPMLESFRLLSKDGPNDKVVALQSFRSKDPLYVDPQRWCHKFSLHHTVGVILTKEEQELIERTVNEENPEPTGIDGST
jgi:hypothetical protein